MKNCIILIVFIFFGATILSADELKGFKYEDRGKRDPFWSLVSPSGTIVNYDNELELTDLALQGVMTGVDGQNLAIINGRILKLNDQIGEYVVTEISKEYVILKKGEQELLLKLKKGGIE